MSKKVQFGISVDPHDMVVVTHLGKEDEEKEMEVTKRMYAGGFSGFGNPLWGDDEDTGRRTAIFALKVEKLMI